MFFNSWENIFDVMKGEGGNFSYNITYVDFFHEKVFYINYFSCPSEVTIQKSKHSNQPLNVGKAFHFQHPSGLVKR